MDDPTHLRTIARLSGDYIVSLVAELTRASGLDPLDLFIFLGVMSANTAHLHDRRMSDEPGLEKRPISTMALSGSVGLPRETCRRRIAALEYAGLIQRSQQGLIAVTEDHAPDAVERFGELNLKLLRRLLGRLRHQGEAL